MKGGYTILDFKDINIQVGNTPTKIEGIYEKIEGNYRKPLLLEGLVINGIERVSRFVVFGNYQGNFRATIGINGNVMVLTCTVTPEDMVTLIEQ